MKSSVHVLGRYELVPQAEPDPDLDVCSQRLQQARIKRVIDVVAVLVGLTLLLPFLLLVAAAVVLDCPGPVLFRQRRTGLNGVPFVIYKFRTMRVQEDGPVVAQARREDERTTRLGKVLRRWSIDELPQLLNVLKGEMSLVGPRPHAVAHDHYYAARIHGYNNRFKAKPGITGLAQVSGYRGEIRHLDEMEARVRADVDYIRVWTVGLDIQILVTTLLTFSRDSAAY